MHTKAKKLLAPTESGLWQLIRFGVVGAISFVADNGTYLALTRKAHVWYISAAVISYLIGIAVSYSLSVSWVFTHRNIKNRRLEFLVFAGIGLVALGLTVGLLYIGVEWVHLKDITAKLIAVFLVFFFNYGARKATMFKHPDKPDAQDLPASDLIESVDNMETIKCQK